MSLFLFSLTRTCARSRHHRRGRRQGEGEQARASRVDGLSGRERWPNLRCETHPRSHSYAAATKCPVPTLQPRNVQCSLTKAATKYPVPTYCIALRRYYRQPGTDRELGGTARAEGVAVRHHHHGRAHAVLAEGGGGDPDAKATRLQPCCDSALHDRHVRAAEPAGGD
eukprot:3659183-Rhodomonas_salina.1